jgi:hypothetical protein
MARWYQPDKVDMMPDVVPAGEFFLLLQYTDGTNYGRKEPLAA